MRGCAKGSVEFNDMFPPMFHQEKEHSDSLGIKKETYKMMVKLNLKTL